MPSFDSFLHPERKSHAKFKMRGFGDAEFEMRVVSREDEALIRNQYPNADLADQMDLMLAFSLVNPPLLKKEFLDALSKREGRPILDPLEAFQAVFDANETKFLWSKYSELADLTVNTEKKIEEIKNASGEGA